MFKRKVCFFNKNKKNNNKIKCRKVQLKIFNLKKIMIIKITKKEIQIFYNNLLFNNNNYNKCKEIVTIQNNLHQNLLMNCKELHP